MADPDVWSWAALAVALGTLTGSLALSLVLGLKACPLCFYQRGFAMSVVAVLGMGLAVGAAPPGRLSLLALPLAVAGLGVALFHVYLEVVGKLECPRGVLGLGTAPRQSLAAFVLLCVPLLADVSQASQAGVAPWAALAGAVVLGAFLTVGSVVANPPPPAPPAAPYPKTPDVCRPPFHPQQTVP